MTHSFHHAPAGDADVLSSLVAITESGSTDLAAEALYRRIEGCMGLQMTHVDLTGRGRKSSVAGFDTSLSADHDEKFATAKTNPLMAYLARMPRNRFLSLEAVQRSPAFLESDYHEQVLSQCGPTQLSVQMVAGRHGLMLIGLAQDTAATAVGQQQLDTLGLQIGLAYDLGLAATSPGSGAFLCDPSGKPLGLHARDVDGLSHGALTLSGPGGEVRPSSLQMTVEFRALMHRARRGTAVHMILPAPSGPCRLTVTPGPILGADHVTWIRVERLRAPEWSASSLGAAYGLTVSEAAVVIHLIDGLPIASIAPLLGLTERTVRTYLSAVLHKTQTRSQAHLLSRIMGVQDE